MKKELISELFEKFENAKLHIDNLECWSARQLQVIFDYAEWRNFLKVIDKAKTACENSNYTVSDHFVDFNKMVEIGRFNQDAKLLIEAGFQYILEVKTKMSN